MLTHKPHGAPTEGRGGLLLTEIIQSYILMRTLILTVACTALAQALWADIVPGKAYRIVPANDNGKAVLVENSAFDNGKKAVVWTDTHVPSQQWLAVEQDGKLMLRNVYTGKYLATSNALAQQTDNASTSAQWEAEAIDASANSYRLKQQSGTVARYLSATATTDGTQLAVTAMKSGDAAQQQTWTFVEETPVTSFTAAMRDEMVNSFLSAHLLTVSGGKTFTKGGWGEAETLETILDAYETTGNRQYLQAFADVYSYFKKKVGTNWLRLVYEDEYKWYGHDFNDDVMWMIIAAARAYHITGSKTYLNDAKRAFDGIYERAYNQWGMLRWAEQSGSKNGTNSCINGPAEVAACYIALGTGDDSYFEKARSLYEQQRRYLYNAQSGAVYDCFTWNADTNLPGGYNYWASTYNQGTMLGAATLLYQHYGDDLYRQDAQHIAQYAMTNMCNAYGIINVCQTVEGDLCGFKGILMRYMRQYAEQFTQPQVVQWLAKNAMAAYCNRNSRGITSSAWLTKAAEDGTFGDKTYNGQAFGNSTAVSAAVNAILSEARLVKDPWTGIEAEHFDTFQGIGVTEQDGRTVVNETGKGKYTRYRNVDFGSTPARQFEITLSKIANKAIGGSVEVRLDSLTATPIATIDAPTTDDWATLTADIAPVAGRHDVYICFKTKITWSNSAFSFDSFRFLTTSTPLMSDATKNGGTLAITPAVDNAPFVIDANPVTAIEVQGHKLCAEYTSPVAILPVAYSLSVGTSDAAADPKTWTLLASNDGEVWTELDHQDGALFAQRAATLRHTVSTDKRYTRFRIDISDNNGADVTSLADLQLIGTADAQAGITADGGSFADAQTGTGTYSANGKYRLTHYAVTAPADASLAATAWTLWGSNNGQAWTAIDHRQAQPWTYGGVTAFFPTGTNEVYSQYRLDVEGEGTVQSYQLFGQLTPSGTFCPGILAGGGTLAASGDATAQQLAALTDADATTSVRVPLVDGKAWVMYKSPWPFRLKSYSVCAGSDKDKAPKTWKVEVSKDGTAWTSVKTELNKTFAKRGTMVTSALTNSAEWQYIRLNVSALASADATEMVIDDWQVNGQCLTASALSASGTTVTALVPVDNANEGADKVADNSVSTKYCFSFFDGVWMNYELGTPAVANMYSLSSANDNAARDPQQWTLMGSNDGTEWVTLDKRDQQAFADRQVTQFYAFNNDKAYKQYRLVLNANGGDHMTQLSEWQLLYNANISSGIGQAATQQEAQRLVIAPNPVADVLRIQATDNGTLYIYSQTGQLALSCPVAEGTNEIGVSALAPGLYVAQMATTQGRQVAKMIKK